MDILKNKLKNIKHNTQMTQKYNANEFVENVSKETDLSDQVHLDNKSLMVSDKIRGCIYGGAAGDALGYPVEFRRAADIFERYGEGGICEYETDRNSGKALISDDTQMTLFTANGILVHDTRKRLYGESGKLRSFVSKAYQDWLVTQEIEYEDSRKARDGVVPKYNSWLCDVPELYDLRAPGNTCLSGLKSRRCAEEPEDYINAPINVSKGCGSVMRIAPLGLREWDSISSLDMEAAQVAAVTHCSSLGYMPAAVMAHIINRIVFPEKEQTLKEIVVEAKETAEELFSGDAYIGELSDIIELAVKLSENKESDVYNISILGEGWVAEEALAISIYCSLRYQDDFSAGIIAAVNHDGDSDSTGAVTGNILGALLGYGAIEDKWKQDLELSEVILEMADDLCRGCQVSEKCGDSDWARKYIEMRWKE